jgi:hypothetical protein
VLLAASLLQVPFGASLETRLPPSTAVPPAGGIAGSFLVVARHVAADGSQVVTLKPLALGELTVPLAEAQPSRVEVAATLPPDAGPRPLLVPDAPPFPLGALAAPLAAVAVMALLAHLLRRRRRSDPLAALQASLGGLRAPAAWAAGDAPDRLARACRGFLQTATAAPCAAMTTRELSRLLVARLGETLARPFTRALALADDARFAAFQPPAAAAVEAVNGVLAAAPEIALARGGRR